MKSESYVPNYSKGEIIVVFKDEPREVKELIGYEGYKYVGEGVIPGEHIINVGEGNEHSAIKYFESKGDKIKAVYRRDLKFEKNHNLKEKLKRQIQDLEEEQPEFRFKSDLEEIAREIKKFNS